MASHSCMDRLGLAPHLHIKHLSPAFTLPASIDRNTYKLSERQNIHKDFLGNLLALFCPGAHLIFQRFS